jgi:hypothetical protein
VDARIAPGIGKVKLYAQNWAKQSATTPHTDAPASATGVTKLGKLDWMQSSITLRLPQGWRAPRNLHAVAAACSE